MDFKGWETPLVGLLTAIVGAIFGKQVWRKRENDLSVEEAEGRVSRNYVQSLQHEKASAIAKYEDLLIKHQAQREEMAAMKLRGALRDEKIEHLQAQVEKLTEALVHLRPDLRPWLTSEGFGVIDIPIEIPRKKT